MDPMRQLFNTMVFNTMVGGRQYDKSSKFNKTTYWDVYIWWHDASVVHYYSIKPDSPIPNEVYLQPTGIKTYKKKLPILINRFTPILLQDKTKHGKSNIGETTRVGAESSSSSTMLT